MRLEEYLNLIPSQHRQKPRYISALTALLRPLTETEDLTLTVKQAFDLDSATGAQLDAVGVRVGRSRYLHTPLEGVYFAWEEEKVGWEQGVWQGKFDPVTGLTALSDDIYRQLLKAKVAANEWDGSTPGAYGAWEVAFKDLGCVIVIQDTQDMAMIVGLAGLRLTPVFEQLLLQGYIPLKPEGVRVHYYAVTLDGGPLFAWDCDTAALAGWGGENRQGGRWPELLRPLN
jgi:hypothetical protein